MVAHQAPPSLGFSRQEHWSGLPFPSPMHESEKWKRSHSVVSDSSRPRGLQPTRLLRPWDFPGRSTGVGCHCLLRLFFWDTYTVNASSFDVFHRPLERWKWKSLSCVQLFATWWSIYTAHGILQAHLEVCKDEWPQLCSDGLPCMNGTRYLLPFCRAVDLKLCL